MPSRHEAQRRHALHYLERLREADALYLQGGAALSAGLPLFHREWENIRTGQAWAEQHADDDQETAEMCLAYAGVGINLLDLHQHPRDHRAWLETALKVARGMGNREAESAFLLNLGAAYVVLGEIHGAIACDEQALVVTRESGDQQGEGMALGNLASAYAELGDDRRVMALQERRLAIARALNDRRGESAALTSLGNASLAQGEPGRARDFFEQALAIDRESGDRRGASTDLGNLGNTFAALGDGARARECYEQQLKMARELGDRRSEGTALGNLGTLLLDSGGLCSHVVQESQCIFKAIEK